MGRTPLLVALLFAVLFCTVGFPQSPARGDDSPAALPPVIYLLQVTTTKGGQLITKGPMLLSSLSRHYCFESGDYRPGKEGYFEMKFDAWICASLPDADGTDGASLPTFEPGMQLTAFQNAARFDLGDIRLRLFAPGCDEFVLQAWRIDTAGLSAAQLETLTSDPELGEDHDVDGVPSGPGAYLGALRWHIASPDLGYIRDVAITPEQLKQMQFGQPGSYGGSS